MKAIGTLGAATWLAFTMAGCAGSNAVNGDQDMATLAVEAFYRERIMVPPNTVLRVTLEDVSKMDVAATVISEVERENPGAPPYKVELAYDRGKIDGRFRYAVRASLRADGKLLFTTTDFVDAFAEDHNGKVEVMMQRVP
jgi:putative lipoprotein